MIMTADSEKCYSQCLICNSKLSTRNTVPIFGEKSGSRPERPLAEVIFSVLEIEANSSNLHSNIICRKCKKLFEEVFHLILYIVIKAQKDCMSTSRIFLVDGKIVN